MRLIAPDGYPEFRCIADKCRHSCCVGWEIDIDPATRDRYRAVTGPFGARLNAAIQEGAPATFRLGPDERCPMLNANGLCDLITELGEGALCQICADHPRFRSEFADRTEIGLGLCCEAAARLLLTQEAPMGLITLEDDGLREALPEEEADLLALRDSLLALLQDRSQPLSARLDGLLAAVGFSLPDLDWQAVYRDLERLDPAWEGTLETLDLSLADPDGPFALPLEQFAAYLLYRHLPGALEDGDVPGRVGFAVLSTRALAALCAARPGCTLDDLLDLARMYSAEVEYSEDNIAALLDALYKGE